VKRTWADLSRSVADLNYAPSLSFDDGLADFVRWLRS
jgi:nucleoside-diphosphate-sugar epimerase